MRKLRWMGICLLFILLTGCMNQAKPEDSLNRYIDFWENARYEEMYDMLSVASRGDLTKEDFATRFRNIYEGIEARNVSITATPITDADNDKTEAPRVFPFTMNMDTAAGTIQETGFLHLEQDENGVWGILWSPSLFFPTMQEGDTVRVHTLKAARGEITDRNGRGLALNGSVEVVGIVPGQLGPDAEKTKALLAERIGLPIEVIDRKLAASWVKDDLFVPVAYLTAQQVELDFRDLQGVLRRKENARVYPLGEAAAHLTGYIREVTEEDLSSRPEGNYQAGDLIGKAGSEQVYEEVLRGRDGKRISIVDAAGQTKKVLAETKAVDGQDVRLTIDADLQVSIYEALHQDVGTAAALQPKTGEILALVSSPAYDPNTFITGLSNEQWEAWNSDPDKPLLNRFTKLYSPGSAFKAITAAAGLELGISSLAKQKEIHGTQWSKDASWGDYYVKRVNDIPVVDLRDAMVYSDNIYFAQEALEMGADAFQAQTSRFIFEEGIQLPYPFPRARISNDGIQNEIQLADSGYGQGEVVMSPLHLALAYTPFINEGELISPVLDLPENEQSVRSPKATVISAETANLVKSMLVDAVQVPDSTGHGAFIQGIEIAGKTGTAELKSKKGESGQENGWFVAFDTAESRLLLAMMIEGVEGRGGSGYVVHKAAPVMKAYLGNE